MKRQSAARAATAQASLPLHQLVAGVVEFLDSHSFFNASFRVKMKIRQKSRVTRGRPRPFPLEIFAGCIYLPSRGDRAADIWRAICFFRPSAGSLSCQFSVRTPKAGPNLMHSQPTSVTAIITSALFTRPFLNMYLGSSPWPDGDGPYGGRQRVGDVVARRRYPQIGYDREVQALGYAYHDGYGHGRAGGVVDDVGEDDVCRHDDKDEHELAVELHPGDELGKDLPPRRFRFTAHRAPCRRRRGRRAPT